MRYLLPDKDHKPRSVEELLLEFKDSVIKDYSSELRFEGVEKEKDVYNITAPFRDGDGRYIAGRVEARNSEYSKVVFFREEENSWKADESIKKLDLQDPFITRIDEELILGGVEVFEDVENPGQLNYRTIFYRGRNLHELKKFTYGPDKMKDIRLCQLLDGRILVMTRPQGEVGGRGKIAYRILDSLDLLGVEEIEKAVVIQKQFLPEEWGGCNELHLLKNGKVGILSHIAKYDERGDRHYYSTAFYFDWETGDYSPMKIIAVRDNFQDGPSKRPDLKDVIFSGGLIRGEQGKAELYCGVSDAQGHMTVINDPFWEYENEHN